MAKGKKGKKDKDEAATASSTAEAQPSTSQEQAQATPQPQPPKPVADKGDENPADDDDGLGLGLGHSKKKNKKKKPPARQGAPVAAASALEILDASRIQISEPPPSQVPSQPTPQAPSWGGSQPAYSAPVSGQGRGQGRGRGQHGPPSDTGYGPPIHQQGRGFGPPTQQGPAPGYGPPTQQGPVPGYGLPTQQGPAPGYGPPTQQGPGPGYGPPMQQGPAPGYGLPTQQGPAPGYGLPTQQGPGPKAKRPVQEAPEAGDGPKQALQSYKPLSAKACRFSVPAKITTPTRVSLRHISVLTNYLPLTFKPIKVYRYDVTFVPDKPKKFIPQAYAIARKKLFPKEPVAFDQVKNMYTPTPLKFVPAVDRYTLEVIVTDNNGRDVKFQVSFKATGVVDLNNLNKYMESGTSLCPPTEEIQVIDVVLRQGTLEAYVKAGRTHFKRPVKPINLSGGLEMWTGLFQSAIFTSRPFINIDVAHKGFPIAQPLKDTFLNDFRGRMSEGFRLFVKGLRVVATLIDDGKPGRKREFICNDVADLPSKQMFMMDNRETGRSERISVADYFAREKKYKLRQPNLNCLWVGPRDKQIFIPMELLDVAYGQVRNRQLDEFQLQNMVRQAATPPGERKRKIHEVISDMQYSKNPIFTNFGLQISENFHCVKAKVLQPPVLKIGGQRTVVPRRGVWQANGLLKPETLTKWGIMGIELDKDSMNYEALAGLIQQEGRSLSMQIAAPLPPMFNVRMTQLRERLAQLAGAGAVFVFVVLPGRFRDAYYRLKQAAEREIGILTQCLKENTAMRRMDRNTMRNILLKVNSKLMGVNQAIHEESVPKCLDGHVMLVGADVTHPSPDQSNIPSIAAVSASCDRLGFSYNVNLSIQTPKKEMIVQFEEMMYDHFIVYKKMVGTFPKKVYIFRDGVSEGQFAEVLQCELSAVHKAYLRLPGNTGGHKPQVLFVLVQKRHHTRFFVNREGSNDNVEPGTVVDEDIVHARELDFYLVSHHAIKGTARPTRYHAVCNDGQLPQEEVEQLAFYLCHMYSRCSRSVSYPTPTYYAHLACMRARALTYGEQFDNQDLERNPKRLQVLDKMLHSSKMFFV